MTMEQLLEEARKAPVDGRHVRCMDRWMPMVHALRAKNYTYRSIWQWLKDRREPVHDNDRVFASAASRRYRSYLKTL